jgi:spore coat protein A
VLFAVAVLATSAWGAARAETVTLVAAMDTTMYQEDNTRSDGAGAYLFAGNNNDESARRALIAFDVGAVVPPGSTIDTVELRLLLSRTNVADNPIDLHRVTAAWGEGSSRAAGNEGGGGPAAQGDATWTYREWPDKPWTNPGGDFVASVSASTLVQSSDTSCTWSDSPMVQDVQGWLDNPAQNFGWILVGESSQGASSKRFDSRNGSPATAPQLTITFTPPAQPIGACCAADGSCGFVLDPGQACAGSYQGVGTRCVPNSCPPPIAVCCQLDAGAMCSLKTQADCTANQGGWHQGQTACDPNPCTAVLTPFVDPLPLPAVATPLPRSAGLPQYRMSMVERQQKLHRDLPPTTVWGFDDGTTGGGTPGPTLETRAGVPIQVTWTNDLRDASGTPLSTHALPVDTCVDGASSSAPRTVVHLHGGHVPEASDGDPEATLLPGQAVTYDYPNNQGAATLWYHDHAMGITRLNVMMGLAGFYILRDDNEDALGLPSGKYEVPLVIQDRSFHPDGSFNYPAMWMEHFFGDTVMVNGKVWPYLKVDRGLYRFRILNGSNSRTYKLTFSPFVWFVQIGSDGGLLRSGVAKTDVTIAPGERADVVVDFSTQSPGQSILLLNSAPAPYPSGDPANDLANVMKFVVTSNAGLAPGRSFVNLRSIDPLDPQTAAQTRDFLLDRADDPCGGGIWRINELGYDDITEMPHLGTTEIWRFINNSGEAHPMHLHLVQFQLLDRQPFVISDGDPVLTGTPKLPEIEESGWKDTIVAMPFQVTRIIARFEDYVGRFPYHCHMLEHEDHAMMRQFQTLPPCGDGGCPGPDGAIEVDGSPVSLEPAAGGGCQCGLAGDRNGTGGVLVVVLGIGICVSARRRRGANNLLGCLLAAAIVLSACSSTGNRSDADASGGRDARLESRADALVGDAHPDIADRAPVDADAGGTVHADAGATVDADAGGAVDVDAGLPFGASCTTDAGCQSGWCALFGNGSMHCTVSCADGQVCPVGTQGSKCNGKGFCAY